MDAIYREVSRGPKLRVTREFPSRIQYRVRGFLIFNSRDRILDEVKLFGSALTFSPNHVAKGVSMPPLQSVFLRGLQPEDFR